MKKLMYIFGIAALMLAAGCSKDDGWNIPNGIKPVKPSKELTAFFDENLGLLFSSLFGEYDGVILENPSLIVGEYDENLGCWRSVYVDTCIMVNSMAEFEAIHLPDGTPMQLTLPPIDFNKHTLVIGQRVGSSSRKIVAQRIVVEPQEVTMNLLLRSPELARADNIVEGFWGLYTKLPQVPISVLKTTQYQ